MVEHCSCANEGCVCFKLELARWVGLDEDWCVGNSLDDGFLCAFLLWAPFKWYILFCESSDWCGNDGKVFAEHAVVSCASKESSGLFEGV